MVKINPKAEKLYPVICSWCGKIVRYSTIKNSSGICQSCRDKVWAEIRA